ncbi:MAG: DnaJ domain-containing protein [Phycisphaerales bacterium]|nr:DnaJ domain-containing protein [Phycisphaerales bacterium]
MTHYERLGIDRNASLDEIKSAFRRKAKRTHPDARHGAPEERKLESQEFAEIVRAYEALIDPERRAAYDGDLERRARRFRETESAPLADFRKVDHSRPNVPTKGRRDKAAAFWFLMVILLAGVLSDESMSNTTRVIVVILMVAIVLFQLVKR